MSVVEIRDLSKIYNNSNIAFNAVSLDILNGEIIGIAGPDFSGKSSLLAVMARKQKQTSGTVNYADYVNISYFSSDFSLPDDLKVFDFTLMLVHLNNTDSDSRHHEIVALLKTFDLHNYASYQIGDLSFSQKRTLAILGTLINKPNLLILDEPFQGLNAEEIEKLTISLKNILHREMACVITDVKLDNLERIASSIALMFEGAIIHKSDILSYSRIAGRNIIQLSVEGNLLKFEEKLTYLTLQKELTYIRSNSIFTITFYQSRQMEDCFFLLSDMIKRLGLSVLFMKSISPQVDLQLIDIVQGRLQLGRPHFQSLLKNIDALENSLDLEES
jgi:ABC-2 type transport system ATP-binding protein